MKNYFPLFLLFLISHISRAQLTTSLTVTGSDWTVTSLSSASTITKAGKNYEPTASELSLSTQTYIKVSALLAWGIRIQQTSTLNWDTSLKIYAQRMGDGIGGAAISGGTTPVEVSTQIGTFFTGSLNLGFSKESIPIQYKITGLSVLLPAKTYTTTITYTVYGL